ncbi:MAG: hypothetical protein QF464_22160, partial [Myxococcota bacterium]|nr:hypothetical protein [Myxococcota bacterium]
LDDVAAPDTAVDVVMDADVEVMATQDVVGGDAEPDISGVDSTSSVDSSTAVDSTSSVDSTPGDAVAEVDSHSDASADASPDGQDVVDAELPPEPVVVAGDHCAEPIPVAALDLPFQYDGDTTHAFDDLSLGGGCDTGGDIGAGAPDVVFSFTPVVTAHHVIGMNPATVIGASPAVIYVLESCDAAAFSCVGVSSNLSAGGVFSVYLEADVTYSIVVDGLLAEDAGGFSFVVEEVVCVIQCPGPECGKDGCGGFCGEGCAEDQACRPDGICDDPSVIEGNTCELPYVIDALPFATTGDTWYGTPESLFAAASCPGEPNTIGAASNDHYYQLTVETTGLYSMAVNSDYDSALYVITDCTNPSGTCLAGSDASLSAESMEVYLEAGQVVTIV